MLLWHLAVSEPAGACIEDILVVAAEEDTVRATEADKVAEEAAAAAAAVEAVAAAVEVERKEAVLLTAFATSAEVGQMA